MTRSESRKQDLRARQNGKDLMPDKGDIVPCWCQVFFACFCFRHWISDLSSLFLEWVDEMQANSKWFCI